MTEELQRKLDAAVAAEIGGMALQIIALRLENEDLRRLISASRQPKAE